MKRIVPIIIALFLAVPSIVVAHSGGTDSNGGHHDYNNVSGLGSYHYHHGYGPHLHDGGICPYDSNNSSNVVQIDSNDTDSLPEQAERLAKLFNYVDGEKYNKVVEKNESLKNKNQQLKDDIKCYKRWLLICIIVAIVLICYLYHQGKTKYEEGYAKGKKEANQRK